MLNKSLFEVIVNLQKLPSLENFALGGGTNLALKFNHRISVDIDLFCDEIIGIVGFEKIYKEVSELFAGKISGLDFPCKLNDQFVFLRFFIFHNNQAIKVEILQNFKRMFEIEKHDQISFISLQDIGLYKLISASNRASKKDIYDLDLITDHLPLFNLMLLLKAKENRFTSSDCLTIFDLDKEKSPTSDPLLLVKFDLLANNSNRPSYSNDSIQILENRKNWRDTRYSWIRKVRIYFAQIGVEYPKTN